MGTKSNGYFFVVQLDGKEITSKTYPTLEDMMYIASFWIQLGKDLRYFGPAANASGRRIEGLPLTVELTVTKQPVITRSGSVWIVKVPGTDTIYRTQSKTGAQQRALELAKAIAAN